MQTRRCVAVAFVLLIGASGSARGAAKPKGSSTYVDTKVQLVLIDPAKPVTVTARVPAGYKRTNGNEPGGFVTFQLSGTPDIPAPTIEISVSCGGGCTPKEIDTAIEVLVPKGVVDAYQRPNKNTGDAKLDAVRAPVKITGQGTLRPFGKWIALDVRTPDPSEPYTELLAGVCVLHRTGEDFYVKTTVLASRSNPAQFKVLLDACKTTH